MTRDEYREKCIQAQKKAFISMVHEDDRKGLENIWLDKAFAAAFDALHNIARVISIEATEEMIEAAIKNGAFDITLRSDYAVMSTTGDLTNPPEPKP